MNLEVEDFKQGVMLWTASHALVLCRAGRCQVLPFRAADPGLD